MIANNVFDSPLAPTVFGESANGHSSEISAIFVRVYLPKLERFLRGKLYNRSLVLVDVEQISLIAVHEFITKSSVASLCVALETSGIPFLLCCIAKRRLVDELIHERRLLRSVSLVDIDESNIARRQSQFDLAVEHADQMQRFRLELTLNESLALDLLLAGYSVCEIATKLGVSRKTVTRWRKRMQHAAVTSELFANPSFDAIGNDYS